MSHKIREINRTTSAPQSFFNKVAIRGGSRRIQKRGNKIIGLQNQQNKSRQIWFKNTTDLDHKL